MQTPMEMMMGMRMLCSRSRCMVETSYPAAR